MPDDVAEAVTAIHRDPRLLVTPLARRRPWKLARETVTLDRIDTMADGIAVKRVSDLTLAHVTALVDEVVTVSEEDLSRALLVLLERTKAVVEPAGAAPLAAALAGKLPPDDGEAACLLLSGGNIDPTLLIAVMRHGLTLGARYLVLRTRVPDRPGELAKLLELVAEQRVNVQSVVHHREGMAISVGETEVELTLLTRDEEHCAELLGTLEQRGYPVQRLR